jgi:hypothetical protein
MKWAPRIKDALQNGCVYLGLNDDSLPKMLIQIIFLLNDNDGTMTLRTQLRNCKDDLSRDFYTWRDTTLQMPLEQTFLQLGKAFPYFIYFLEEIAQIRTLLQTGNRFMKIEKLAFKA